MGGEEFYDNFTFLSRVNNLTCFICFCNSRVEQQPWYQSIVGHNFPLRFSDFCKGAIAPRINFPFNKGLLLNPHQRPTLAKIVKISPPFTFWPSYRFICTLLEKKLHRKFRPEKDFDLTLKGSYKHQILGWRFLATISPGIYEAILADNVAK